jgi:RNA polymerase-binding transcription factor DksA
MTVITSSSVTSLVGPQRRMRLLRGGLAEKRGVTMTREECESYRERLLSLGARLCRDRANLKDEALRGVGGETSGSFSDVPLHPGDLGTHYFEEEMTLALLQNEEQLIEEINVALERIEQGTFGHCEVCQSAIPKERLMVLPYTRRCVECSRKLQKGPAS